MCNSVKGHIESTVYKFREGEPWSAKPKSQNSQNAEEPVSLLERIKRYFKGDVCSRVTVVLDSAGALIPPDPMTCCRLIGC